MIRLLAIILILQFGLGGISGCVVVQKVRNDKSEFHYKLANNWLKLAMVAGLLTPVIWRVLFYYGA